MCDYIRHIMWIELWKAPIWNVLVAIGTVSSVIVSLYIANRKSKVVRKLNIVKQFKESYSKGEIYMFTTIENIGNIPIILGVRLKKIILKFAIHLSINYLLKQV